MRRSAGIDRAPWSELAAEDPDFAGRVEGRFAGNLHHVLGTLRTDGAPRLSGTEVRIADGEVMIGMMPGSRKLSDVRRDPRVEIHSAPIEEDLVLGDAKLAGVLIEVTEGAALAEGALFHLAMTLVSLVRVDNKELLLTIWRPGDGTRSIRRR